MCQTISGVTDYQHHSESGLMTRAEGHKKTSTTSTGDFACLG